MGEGAFRERMWRHRDEMRDVPGRKWPRAGIGAGARREESAVRRDGKVGAPGWV
jgi:hypothetical protein